MTQRDKILEEKIRAKNAKYYPSLPQTVDEEAAAKYAPDKSLCTNDPKKAGRYFWKTCMRAPGFKAANIPAKPAFGKFKQQGFYENDPHSKSKTIWYETGSRNECPNKWKLRWYVFAATCPEDVHIVSTSFFRKSDAEKWLKKRLLKARPNKLQDPDSPIDNAVLKANGEANERYFLAQIFCEPTFGYGESTNVDPFDDDFI